MLEKSLQRIIDNALEFNSTKKLAEEIYVDNIDNFEIKTAIENGLKFRSTRDLAQKMYFENFSQLNIEERVLLANQMELNLLITDVCEKHNLDKEDYLKTVKFCMKSLQPSRRGMRLELKSKPLGVISLKYNKSVNQWLDFIHYFNDEELNKQILLNFKKLLESKTYPSILEGLKGYVNKKEEFEEYYSPFELKEINKSVLIFFNKYPEAKLDKIVKIGLFFKEVSESERFLNYMEKANDVEIPFNWVDLEVLKDVPVELKSKLKIKILKGDVKALNTIKSFDMVGFQYGTDFNKEFELTIAKLKKSGMPFEKILATFGDETKMFFLESFDLKSLKNDHNFKMQVYNLLKSYKYELTEDEKELLLVTYKI